MPTLVCAAVYLLAWIGSLCVLAFVPGGSIVEPLFILGIFGVALRSVALATTRRLATPPAMIARSFVLVAPARLGRSAAQPGAVHRDVVELT
ncbi:MAG TPA: hypothetical protein VE620_08490 [Myxococcales bacterium]|nr:hypothetical protein [Myxococcales bacterium]